MAQEEYFALVAKEAQRAAGGDKRSEEAQSVTPTLGEAVYPKVPRHARESSARAAQTVGMKPETYRKGKKVLEDAPEQVKEEWAKGEVSTNAAFQIARATSHPRDWV